MSSKLFRILLSLLGLELAVRDSETKIRGTDLSAVPAGRRINSKNKSRSNTHGVDDDDDETLHQSGVDESCLRCSSRTTAGNHGRMYSSGDTSIAIRPALQKSGTILWPTSRSYAKACQG